MRAAVIAERGALPVPGEFPEPTAKDGAVLIDVDTAGLGGWDTLGAYRLGVQFPCVIRGEGVGRRVSDGRRVYFGERSVAPFGAWAERTLVPTEEVWEVPSDVDDKTAVSLGIAATGAIVPLQLANIQSGENVLIIGATGTLGRIALQLARRFGAGHIVGASRSKAALANIKQQGLADEVVTLGGPDDVAALKAAAREGFDVVLDLVCGQPLLSALKATRWRARIMTIGTGAGRQINLDVADLLFRTLSVVGTGQRAAQDRQAIWQGLLAMNRQQRFEIEYKDYSLPRVTEAWQSQLDGAHAKITAAMR
jgi:NADPH:quinone reductase